MRAPLKRSVALAGSAAAAVALVGCSAGRTGPDRSTQQAAGSRTSVVHGAPIEPAVATEGPRTLDWTPTGNQLSAAAQALSALAEGVGDAKPISAVWTTSTRGRYLAATGEGSPSDAHAAAAQVIVMVAAGDFTYTGISVPYGVAMPTGKYVECAYDPAIGGITDWGTDDPALDQLGPVSSLTLGQ